MTSSVSTLVDLWNTKRMMMMMMMTTTTMTRMTMVMRQLHWSVRHEVNLNAFCCLSRYHKCDSELSHQGKSKCDYECFDTGALCSWHNIISTILMSTVAPGYQFEKVFSSYFAFKSINRIFIWCLWNGLTACSDSLWRLFFESSLLSAHSDQ